MPCAVAVPNSPIFSPSKVASIFFKSPASSPRLVQVHGSASASAPSPTSSFQSPAKSPLAGRVVVQGKVADMGLGSGSGTVLKRKRPSRIDIPIASLNFATDSPKSSERVDVVEAEGDGYSVYCKRGRRAVMEDRYSAVVDLQAESRQAFFGVFDGHGGAKAAEFAAKNLDSNIVNRLTRGNEKEIVEAVKGGYLTTDEDFLKEEAHGGTCCVTALIQKHNLVVSNAGDCRAVMSRGGVAEALTTDHRPSRKDERDRIENLGGYVDCCTGVWRIQGSLAVSRGIGDRNLKQWVIAEPETKVLEIKPECEFLILGSDGLWDKVTNQEAVDIVRPLCIGVDKPEPFSACKKLVELSVRRGSIDDISVVVIQLGQFIS
ncbi:Protein phosphatase [Trema orientale]|uniref:protein-serine/threonine phosphatase n=1 Tax=Trema orientale TaxID=63057 RepID=A0A2P5ELY6_TREOI|nr:Protein phosphatase [Trema orientale]